MLIYQRCVAILAWCFISSCFGDPVPYENGYAPGHEYGHKDYSYSYGVKDLHTGDVKHQWEKKVGDNVQGRYALLEPDGTVRVVDYTASKKSGFNAVVQHKGPAIHPTHTNPLSFKEVNIKEGGGLEEYARTGAVPEKSYYGNMEYAKNFPPNHKYTYVEIEEPEKHQYSDEDLHDYESKNVYTKHEHKPDLKHTKYQFPAEDYTKLEPTTHKPKDTGYPKHDTSYKYPAVDTSYKYPTVDTKQTSYKYPATDNPYKEEPVYVTNPPKQYKHTTKPELPVDISLLKPSLSSKDVEVEYLNPVVLDLTKGKDFKPKYPPNTYQSNKKPVTTPGLRNFASSETKLHQPHGNNHILHSSPRPSQRPYKTQYPKGKGMFQHKRGLVRPPRQQKYIHFLTLARHT